MMRHWIGLLCAGLILSLLVSAQDRQETLQLSVALRSLINRSKIDGEKREKLTRLMQEAAAQSANSPSNGVFLLLTGFAFAQDVKLTPEVQFAAAIRILLKEYVLEPGQPLQLEIIQLARVEEWPKDAVDAELFLQPVQPKDAPLRPLKTLSAINQVTLPTLVNIEMPTDIVGPHRLIVKLPPKSVADNEKLVQNPTVKKVGIQVGKDLKGRFTDLEKRIEIARNKLFQVKPVLKPTSGKMVALDTAEYSFDLYQQAKRNQINPLLPDLEKELAAASELVSAVEKGVDPYRNKKGDHRRAYRSSFDQKVQPYRVLVPKTYSAAKPTPLVVALHGMGGDENTMLDFYEKAYPQEAEKRGYLLVAPKGRGPASMYFNEAEQDVMDVLAQVKAQFNVDPKRIYLTGHSMGAYGTWSIAMHHPDGWAALAPISGGGNVKDAEKIAHLPQYVVHGDADPTVLVRNSQLMVEELKRLKADVTYVEVKGGGHNDVVVPQVPAIFDWFSKQVKPAFALKK
jgi:predicted esterase